MSMNPFDEIAVRGGDPAEGSRQGHGGRGRVRGRGASARRRCAPPWRWAPTARSWSRPTIELQPLAVAKLLKAIVDKEQPGLVLMGKQAIDDDSNQTPQMLAALLGWPQATFVSKLAARRRQRHGQPRGRRGPGAARGQAAGRDQRRSAPERAALRVAAQHHEGEEEAGRRAEARGPRRRCRAAAALPEVRGAAPSGRPAPRSARWPSWWPSSRPRRGCSDGGPGPGPARQRRRSTRPPCTR